MTEHLRPCPFCGGPAEIWRAHKDSYHRKAWIACVGSCGGQRRGTVLTTEYETDAEAIAAWNRRALGPALDVVLQNLRDNKQTIWGQLFDNGLLFFELDTLEKQLRALRDAHSPTNSEEDK